MTIYYDRARALEILREPFDLLQENHGIVELVAAWVVLVAIMWLRLLNCLRVAPKKAVTWRGDWLKVGTTPFPFTVPKNATRTADSAATFWQQDKWRRTPRRAGK